MPPLSGPSSYVPTLNAFKSHWETVDAEGDSLTITDPRDPAGTPQALVILEELITELTDHADNIAGIRQRARQRDSERDAGVRRENAIYER